VLRAKDAGGWAQVRHIFGLDQSRVGRGERGKNSYGVADSYQELALKRSNYLSQKRGGKGKGAGGEKGTCLRTTLVQEFLRVGWDTTTRAEIGTRQRQSGGGTFEKGEGRRPQNSPGSAGELVIGNSNEKALN